MDLEQFFIEADNYKREHPNIRIQCIMYHVAKRHGYDIYCNANCEKCTKELFEYILSLSDE